MDWIASLKEVSKVSKSSLLLEYKKKSLREVSRSQVCFVKESLSFSVEVWER